MLVGEMLAKQAFPIPLRKPLTSCDAISDHLSPLLVERHIWPPADPHTTVGSLSEINDVARLRYVRWAAIREGMIA